MTAWGASRRTSQTWRRVDAIVLTVLRSELDAMLAVDAGAVPGSTWELATGPSGLPVAFRPFVAAGAGADRPLRIAVAKAPDAGATAATETLLPLIEAWGPRCIAMCGVCDGRRGKTELGDVVAAERLFYRDTGKQLPDEVQQDLTTYKLRDDWKAALEGMAAVERFRDEPWLRARPLPARWAELSALVALRDGAAEPWRALGPPDARRWSDVVVSLRERGLLAASGRELTDAGRRLVDDALFEHAGALPDLSAAGAFQPFRVHVAPLATGAQTVEDEAIWACISQAMCKTLGLETEAAALGELVHRQRQHRLDAVVMKGVMGFADGGDERHFEAFAARASAECLLGEAMVLRVARPPRSHDAVDDAWITRVLILRDDEAALTSAFIVLGRMLDRVPVRAQSAVRMWIRCLLLADLPGRAVLALRAAKKIGEESAYAALGDLLADVLEQHGTGAMAVLLDHEKIPYPTVSLQRVASWRSRKRLQIVTSDDVTRALSERAEALAQRGRDLVSVGQRHEAIAALQEAVVLYQRLERQRGEYSSELAASSNNLGAALNEIGMRDAALGAVKDAIDLYGALVKQAPTHQPDLARALNNLGAILNALGLHEKACEALKDAVALYSVLAANADEYRPQLATCLNNLGAQLTGLGAHAEANAATIRAVKLYRDLASHRHDAFEPDLAWSYHSLGIQLSGLGERREALRFACKAVEMYRRLAARNPDAFEAGLATSLNSAGNRSAELGRFDEAFADTREAVERYRRLAARLPDAFRASLALSLVNLANRHSDLRRPEAALEATREGVEIYRVLATPKDEADSAGDTGVAARKTSQVRGAVSALGKGIVRRITITWRPDAFRLELAMSLTQMSQLLHQLQRHEDAVAALRDAVGVYRLLASFRPEVFRPELARSLTDLSHDQNRIGQHDAAIASAREAVDHYRALARPSPADFEPALARTLTHLGALYGSQGKLTAALAMTVEAVEVCHALFDRDRDAFAPDLARSLLSLSSWKSVVGRRSEALDDARRAVDVYRTLARQAPDAFEPLLASSLQLFALRRHELGKTDDAIREAIEATRAAVELYRALVARHRDELQPALAAALYNLGVLLGERGRRDEAIVEIQEAISFLRAIAPDNPAAGRLLVARLRDLSKRLRDLGRSGEALDATDEGDRIHRALQDRRPRPAVPQPRTPKGSGSAITGAPARPQP